MSTEPRGKVYQFIDDLVEIGAAEITAELPGLEPQLGAELMRRIALAMCGRYARTEMYIPAALEITLLGPRNQQIWDEYNQDGPAPHGARRFTAARMVELAETHGLTTRQVRSIIADMRARDMAARQSQLPGFDPES